MANKTAQFGISSFLPELAHGLVNLFMNLIVVSKSFRYQTCIFVSGFPKQPFDSFSFEVFILLHSHFRLY